MPLICNPRTMFFKSNLIAQHFFRIGKFVLFIERNGWFNYCNWMHDGYTKRMEKLNIIADGSIIAIANTTKYNDTLSFRQHWSWKDLSNFILEQNKDNLIIFNTAWDDEWTIGFSINKITDASFFRKFEQSIEVTDGTLYLVNWTDLTSTLQFEDTKLPDEINETLKISIENGFYSVVVKQLFDHEDFDHDAGTGVDYIVELLQTTENPKLTADHIHWTEDFPTDESLFISSEDLGDFDDFLDHISSEPDDRK